MQARLTARPADEVIAAIQALDLESVKVRIMDAELGEGWTREYADGIEAAYRTYLTMLVKYPDHADDIMLSKDVDEFWHTHILQTRKYSEDCQRVFGNYLHHEPHVGEVTQADLEKREILAEKTRQLYEREFGSGKRADAAWLGNTINSGNAAYSSAAIQANDAAYSSTAVRADRAAYSSAAVNADHAAYSSAAISASGAAYSSAAIKAGNAAYSSAAIRSEHAAYSSAAIRAGNAAYSSAAIRSVNAAYSSAAIRTGTIVTTSAAA